MVLVGKATGNIWTGTGRNITVHQMNASDSDLQGSIVFILFFQGPPASPVNKISHPGEWLRLHKASITKLQNCLVKNYHRNKRITQFQPQSEMNLSQAKYSV